MNGILLLDKPEGFTSNSILQKVKRLLKFKKAGHTGSLDPLASGMLPLCLGEATKFSQFLLNADKHYEVVARLGIKTNTGDSEGEVISERTVGDYSDEKLDAILQKFSGTQQQIPPMFSALKKAGQPLYKLARQGIEVDREPREIKIYDFRYKRTGEKNTLYFSVHCSKGTYIRTLIDDIGEVLGCGAHVAVLRRTAVAHFKPEQMVTLQQLEAIDDLSDRQHYILPIDAMIDHLPRITLSSAAEFYIARGQSVTVANKEQSGFVRLYRHNDQFMGIGEHVEFGKVTPRRLIVS